MSKLEFDVNTHIYTFGNKQIPSVTQILNHFGLIDFSYVKEHIMQNAQSFGKAVHKMCELHDKNDLGEYDSKLEPYLNGYKMFLAAYKPTWKLIEEPLVSKVWGFAGTPDRFGLIKKDTVLDFKTGSEHPANAIQTAGYEILIEENLKVKVKERYSLILLENDFRLIPHKNKSDRTLFLSLISIYRWKLKNTRIRTI